MGGSCQNILVSWWKRLIQGDIENLEEPENESSASKLAGLSINVSKQPSNCIYTRDDVHYSSKYM